MRRFANFLKDAFTAPPPQILPATSLEMTLHDALRIGSRPAQSEKDVRPPPTAVQPIHICRYESEADLRAQWRRLDTPQQAANLAVILMLGDFLRSNLSDVIHRRWLASRLVVVRQAGHWPGIDSFGDLALAAHSRGWNSIELCDDLRDALLGCTETRCEAHRRVMFLPSRAAL